MGFKALDEVYQRHLELPGRDGKIYRVPEADFETGLWCTRAFIAAEQVARGEDMPTDTPRLTLEGDDELTLQRRLLGAELLDELISDGFGKPTIDHFTSTAFFWHAAGREVAESFWNAGGRPEDFLHDANRAARRRRASTSTAAAPTTKRRASGSGTTSPRKSAPR